MAKFDGEFLNVGIEDELPLKILLVSRVVTGNIGQRCRTAVTGIVCP